MSSWPGETRHVVRPDECDEQGLLEESSLVGLFQLVRAAYWAELGAPADGRGLRIWDMRLKMLRPVASGTPLLMRAQLDEIAARTLRFRFLIFDDATGAFAVEASSMVLVVGADGSVIDVPADIRAAAEALEGRPFPLRG